MALRNLRTVKKLNRDEEVRLRVKNWDEAVPTMVGQKHGPSRKVVTRGIIRSNDDDCLICNSDLGAEIIAIALEALRKGFEFRLTDENDEDAIRLIPCVEKDMKTVSVVAQTMGSFRASLEDKIVAPFHNGEEIDEEDALKLNKKLLDGKRGKKSVKGGVTPDVMVTCPNCGEQVRVGKHLHGEEEE